MRNSLLAAAAIALAASSPGAAVGNGLGYAIPNGWAPTARSGNNKSCSKHKRERARTKLAAKSRRDQRRRATK